MICHTLVTSALIINIVTVGRSLESRAKKSIFKMTEELFPK